MSQPIVWKPTKILSKLSQSAEFFTSMLSVNSLKRYANEVYLGRDFHSVDQNQLNVTYLFSILRFSNINIGFTGPSGHQQVDIENCLTHCPSISSITHPSLRKPLGKITHGSSYGKLYPISICRERRPRSACALAQSDLGIRCLLTE